MMFYLDQEEQNQQELPAVSQLKKKLELMHSQQHLSESMTQGIISHYIEDPYEDIENQKEGNEIGIHEQIKEEMVVGSRRRKKGKALAQLSPIGQTFSTIVFQNIHQHQSYPDCKPGQPKQPNPSQKHINNSIEIIPYFSQGYDSTPSSSNEIEAPESIHEQSSRQHSSKHSIKSNRMFEFKEKEKLIFQVDLESKGTDGSKSQEFVCLPSQRIVKDFQEESEEEPQKDKKTEQKTVIAQPKKKAIINKNIGIIDTSNLLELKRDLAKKVPEHSIMQLILQRNKDGFNRFWPEFSLHFLKETEGPSLISAKKISSQPSTTYIISTSPENFEENSEYYLGKLKSNIVGDIINLYGPGLNPSDAKENSKIPRELLATIVYAKLSMNKPREFDVYIKKPEYRYYLNFHQITMYEEEIPLSQLYAYQENSDKIEKYSNKKPIFSKERQTFTLNFHGKAECSSIKNFILEKQEGGDNLMMFGKINESRFNIQMEYPLSFLVGFAVALTTFDSRIFLGS